MLSTTFLNPGRDEEFLKGRGRGFQGVWLREERVEMLVLHGTRDEKAERTTWRVVGMRSDLSVMQNLFRILYSRISLAIIFCRGYQSNVRKCGSLSQIGQCV